MRQAHTITATTKFDIAKRILRPHSTLKTIHERLTASHNTPESYNSLIVSLGELQKDDQWLKDQNTLSTLDQYTDPTPTSAGQNVCAFQANTRQTYFQSRPNCSNYSNNRYRQNIRQYLPNRRSNYYTNRNRNNNYRNNYYQRKKGSKPYRNRNPTRINNNYRGNK